MNRWIVSCVAVVTGAATPVAAQQTTPDSAGAGADAIAVHVLEPLVVRGCERSSASEATTTPSMSAAIARRIQERNATACSARRHR